MIGISKKNRIKDYHVDEKLRKVLKRHNEFLSSSVKVYVSGMLFEYSHLEDLFRFTVYMSDLNPDVVFVGNNWFVKKGRFFAGPWGSPNNAQTVEINDQNVWDLFKEGKDYSNIGFCCRCGSCVDIDSMAKGKCTPCIECEPSIDLDSDENDSDANDWDD